jgi:hypothetical protein
MVTTKSKLQMEFNQEVTSASSGLMYVCFVKWSSRGGHPRSLDIGRLLKSVNLIQSSLDYRANVEQFNHQCFEKSTKICEPLDIEVKKPRICNGCLFYLYTESFFFI